MEINNRLAILCPRLTASCLILSTFLLSACLESDDADEGMVEDRVISEQSANQNRSVDKVTALVYEDGSVALAWPDTEGAVEYVVYRNGDYVSTVAEASFNDQAPSTGEYGYEIEAVKSSSNGYVVSALAPVLTVSVEQVDSTGLSTDAGSGNLASIHGAVAPEPGVASGVATTASVATFEESGSDPGRDQVETLTEALVSAGTESAVQPSSQSNQQIQALVQVQSINPVPAAAQGPATPAATSASSSTGNSASTTPQASSSATSSTADNKPQASTAAASSTADNKPQASTVAASSTADNKPQATTAAATATVQKPPASNTGSTAAVSASIAAQTPVTKPVATATTPSGSASSPKTAQTTDAASQENTEADIPTTTDTADNTSAEGSAQAKAEADAKAIADAAAKQKAEAEAQAKAEADAAAKKKAEEEAQAQAEADALAEEKARVEAEQNRLAEADAKAKAEAQAAAEEEAAQVAATAAAETKAAEEAAALAEKEVTQEATQPAINRTKYPNCKPFSSDANGPPPSGICPTTLTKSGPVGVKTDNVVVENLDIDSPDHGKCGIRVVGRKNVTIKNVNINHAGAGICVFDSENVKIKMARMVNTIKQAGPHCRPGLTPKECKFVHRRHNPEKLYPVNTHNNIWIKSSKQIVIDGVYVEKGEAGIYVGGTPGVTINNAYCRDIRGPYWRGQCIMLEDSHDGVISNFFVQQFYETSSGHDNINMFKSHRVTVKNGLIDGNWSRHGAGIIADKQAHDLTIKNVDIIHAGLSGVGVWAGANKDDNGLVARNFYVENVRVRDGHCVKSWYDKEGWGPSSGGLTFVQHPAAVNSKFINSIWWNHCQPTAMFIAGTPTIKDITKQEFTPKAPPIDLNFTWLQY